MSPVSIPVGGGEVSRHGFRWQEGEAHLGHIDSEVHPRGDMWFWNAEGSEKGCPVDTGAIGIEVDETARGRGVHGGKGKLRRAVWKHPGIKSQCRGLSTRRSG